MVPIVGNIERRSVLLNMNRYRLFIQIKLLFNLLLSGNSLNQKKNTIEAPASVNSLYEHTMTDRQCLLRAASTPGGYTNMTRTLIAATSSKSKKFDNNCSQMTCEASFSLILVSRGKDCHCRYWKESKPIR
jgi:hypothetical protein